MNKYTRENWLTATAVLVVGAAGLVLSERHQRQRNVIATTDTHQRWLEYASTRPEVLALWTPDGMAAEEYGRLMQANRLICALSARFRLGILNRRTLRVQANALMDHETVRNYWTTYGGFRESEARDGIDRAFNAIMTDEYTARPETA